MSDVVIAALISAIAGIIGVIIQSKINPGHVLTGGILGLLIGLIIAIPVIRFSPPLEIPQGTLVTESTRAPGNGGGCACADFDPTCKGVIVKAGDQLLESSLLEPAPPNRGTIYLYWKSDIARVDGVAWTYVDSSGSPASRSCVNAQLSAFSFNEIVEIE